jgi:hypothetical protein
MTHYGILRGESLIKCELSDLYDIVLEEEGAHKCHVMVMKIAFGKTNSIKTLYGRVMRHKKVTLCPIGALGFYLLSRFHFTQETLNFSCNASWFDVKLLVEQGSKNVNKGISDQSYAKSIR